ncbi:hypothetical protein E2I00_007671, partial [Balaenoptera physalus]
REDRVANKRIGGIDPICRIKGVNEEPEAWSSGPGERLPRVGYVAEHAGGCSRGPSAASPTNRSPGSLRWVLAGPDGGQVLAGPDSPVHPDPALRSLRRYPLPLHSGKEAKILQHFGDGLCRMLDRRLQQHKASGGDHAPCSPPGAKSPARERPAEVQDPYMPGPTQLKAGGSGKYWPARHSGARAVLLLLYREHLNPSSHGFLTKEELLQRCAQKAPRVAPGSARPWPALRSLLHRNLVLRTQQPARWGELREMQEAGSGSRRDVLSLTCTCCRPEEWPWAGPEAAGLRGENMASGRGVGQPLALFVKGRPGWYSLTPEGLELAQKLAESEGLSLLNVGSGPEEPPGEEPAVPGAASAELGASEGNVQQPPLQLGPGEYRVLLCVDVGETKGAGPRPELLRELQRLHVTHTVRKLHVGDFVWVAQETSPRDPGKGQLMQVHRVSGEKAAALVDQYSTPASLLAAYDACATPEEKEMLLSTIKCGPLQRNLGPALSRTLSQLYCSHGPLT